MRREEEYTRKIIREANAFDNVILEICDEPASIGTGIALAGPWVSHLVDVARDTERRLPKQHLIAQEVEGPFGGPMDFSTDPRVSVIVAQYIWGRDPGESGGEMGGMKGLDFRYDANKPIELNETDYYPLNYRGDKIADARVEAWEFMVGGGAGFNQLNGLYTVQNPAGKTPENEQLLRALRNLKEFLEGFPFTRMRPDKDFVRSGISAGAYCRVISEPGRRYALYLHHSGERKRGSYEAVPGSYRETLDLKLPPGNYRAEWVDPARGAVVSAETLAQQGERRLLQTPRYTVDIALRIQRER